MEQGKKQEGIVKSRKIAFHVPCVEDREHYLSKCIQCFKDSRYYGDCDIYLYYQGKNLDEVQGLDVFTDIITSPVPRGVFTPRYELMKRFGTQYDYVIMIDDDLFIKPDTDYYKSIEFCEKVENVGCITVAKALPDYRSIKRICYPEYTLIDVNGGMILPRESVGIILDYFRDKEADYTEDMFWLLLYVKGKDLYNDKRSMAIHRGIRKSKDGKITGYARMKVEKPYNPIMTEWFNDAKLVQRNDISPHTMVREGKSLKHINNEGLKERIRNCGYF